MIRIPEPAMTPPITPPTPLRCELCLRMIPMALDLHGRIICRACLDTQDLDSLSALLYAPVLENETYLEGEPYEYP